MADIKKDKTTGSQSVSSENRLRRAMSVIDQLEKKVRLLEQKNRELEESRVNPANPSLEPIAIIGMGCRFPGGAMNPEDFWRNLAEGVDGMVDIPDSRWPMADFYSPDRDAAGTMYIRQAGLIDDVAGFDATFFGISPREAHSIDPQHRLLLEVTWEALEHAGIVPEKLHGSDTGVYIGIGQNDYGLLQLYAGDLEKVNAYDGTGNGFCFASGRLSYALGLQGPSLSIDTACSSSLVAIDQACQQLRQGDCQLAIVAGSQLMLSPDVTVFLSRAQALSPESRCRSFDAAADGYARGEGCGVVILKRLADAKKDGDRICAVIRSSQTNHDGPSSGLTVPNGLAQEKLMRNALEKADLSPQAVSYVESHGTGTKLGDPIEADAISSVYGCHRDPSHPVWLGAVKTNVGHLETAAGMAGLIKVVLSLQHQQIPGNLHFTEPNPLIEWQGLRVPTRLEGWSVAPGESRIAGVSSFGMSGTNSHTILEEYLEEAESVSKPEIAINTSSFVLPLSAKSEASLQQLAVKYLNWIDQNESIFPEFSQFACALSHEVGIRRSHFGLRKALVYGDMEQLKHGLMQLSSASHNVKPVKALTNGCQALVAFLFTGQGSQYIDMGKALYETNEIFRQHLDRSHQLLLSEFGISLKQALFGDLGATEKALSQTAVTQPALFALQMALAKTWSAAGMVPDVVMGHSVGEFAAAVVAGIMAYEDALRLVAHRGRLMQALPRTGAMWGLRTTDSNQISDDLVKIITDLIEPVNDSVTIAAINGPNDVVISGCETTLNTLLPLLQELGIIHIPLDTSHAFHSPLMAPMLEAFHELFNSITLKQPKLTFISTVTGKVETERLLSSDYWCQQILSPVYFYQAIETLTESSPHLIVEVGPKPVLLNLARRFQANLINNAGVGCLQAAGQDGMSMMSVVGKAYEIGLPLDWERLLPVLGCPSLQRKTLPSLPTYAWEHQPYWVSAKTRRVWRDGQISSLPMSEEDEQTVLQDSYRIDWQILEDLPSYQNAGGKWLVFYDHQADPAGFEKVFSQIATDSLSSQMIKVALNEELVQPDIERIDSSTYSLNGSNPNTVSQLLKFLEDNGFVPDRVILIADTQELPSNDEINLSHQWGWQVVSLVQALAQQRTFLTETLAAKLWLLVADNETFSCASNSGMAALGRVIAQEHANLWGGILNVPSVNNLSDLHWEQIIRAISEDGGESERRLVSVEGHLTWQVPRLIPLTLETQLEINSLRSGAVLITGSNGGIGQALLTWLAESVPVYDTFFLLSRRHADEHLQKEINRLQQLGKKVICLAGDVSDRGCLARLAQHIKQQGKPLRAIFHTAGQLDDGLLVNQSPEKFARVANAKVDGALALQNKLLARESECIGESLLDLFVLFSSAAALLGAAGQSNYAFANGELDALASQRRKRGLVCTSINWGAWANVGMAASLSSQDRGRLEGQGVRWLEADTAFQSMLETIALPYGNVAIVAMDWAKFFVAKGDVVVNPLLRNLKPPTETQFNEYIEGQESTNSNNLAKSLLALPNHDRVETLVDELQQRVGAILQLPLKQVDLDRGLFDMGMDSLTAVELRRQLSQALGVELPSTVIFDHPSIDDLSQYLCSYWQSQLDTPSLESELSQTDSSEQSQHGATDSMTLDDIGQLSEDEMAAMIEQTYDAL